MRQGLFIVLEGVDGAGTTTQVSQLSAALRDKLAVRETREPTVGPVGALLRLAINGRLVTPGPLGVHAPGWKTLALMFAADRLDHIESEIAPLLAEGVCVISDRYYHSSVAYQSRNADAGPDAIDWIRTINRHARAPDLTIVLDVSAGTAGKRRRQRGGVELFDDDALQIELTEFYRSLERHFPGELIAHVDGEASVEQVASSVRALVEQKLAERV
ncbi:MAG TPA: dTMP kinase [Polyangiales bacterium]|jgi:dTMP kinase|nr:dTMP kinase [Polyangiales bacterium]